MGRRIKDPCGGGPLEVDDEGAARCAECKTYRGSLGGVFVVMPNPHVPGCQYADKEDTDAEETEAKAPPEAPPAPGIPDPLA